MYIAAMLKGFAAIIALLPNCGNTPSPRGHVAGQHPYALQRHPALDPSADRVTSTDVTDRNRSLLPNTGRYSMQQPNT